MTIRAAFFSSYSGLGGGETTLRSLLGGLDPARFALLLICPGEGRLTAAVRALGIETAIVEYRGAPAWFVPWIWERLPATRAIAAQLERWGPTVVVTDFHSLPYVNPACRRLGLPVMFLCWGWWFRPRPWQRGLYRSRPETIWAPSEAVSQGFLGSPPFLSPDRVRVLNPGVDPAVFRPRPEARVSIRLGLGLPPEAPLVTLLARFQVVKGHDVFLRAAKILTGEFPEVRFVIAGENAFGGTAEARFERKVVGMARSDPDLRERVRLLGWTSQPERLLAVSDVLVCSSRFESYGMAPVEAMACAVPVVSTNVGGPAETIVDGEGGFLVPPDRPDLIAERVARLLRDPQARSRMGADGRRRVEERYTLDRFVSAVDRELRTLAAGR